jgi:hypothetical protein
MVRKLSKVILQTLPMVQNKNKHKQMHFSQWNNKKENKNVLAK